MRFAANLLTVVVFAAGTRTDAQGPPSSEGGPDIQVILLGTAGGPTINATRLGISTLVVAGSERLLFDAGRGATSGMVRLAVNPVDVTKVFLPHLHSDHVISLPELDSVDPVFGKVSSGMDVIMAINRVKTNGDDRPLTPVQVVSVTISP